MEAKTAIKSIFSKFTHIEINVGIHTGNYAELYNISSSPGEEHSFLVDSFAQFERLARRALHNGKQFIDTKHDNRYFVQFYRL